MSAASRTDVKVQSRAFPHPPYVHNRAHRLLIYHIEGHKKDLNKCESWGAQKEVMDLPPPFCIRHHTGG
jgi:hypothetical protein